MVRHCLNTCQRAADMKAAHTVVSSIVTTDGSSVVSITHLIVGDHEGNSDKVFKSGMVSAAPLWAALNYALVQVFSKQSLRSDSLPTSTSIRNSYAA